MPLVSGAGGRELQKSWYCVFIILATNSFVFGFQIWGLVDFMTMLQSIDKRQNSWIKQF